MSHPRWRVIGTFLTRSPLHVGDGEETTHPDIVDQHDVPCEVARLARNVDGLPCLPGTAIKGVLRSWAERFHPGNKTIERVFGHRDPDRTGAEAGWAEFLTATMRKPSAEQGERFVRSLPYWRDDRFAGIMSHVCLNRHTGAAARNKLYYEEFVPEGLTFDVEIDATRLEPAEIDLLLAVLQHGADHATHPYQFGANGADGWGRVAWTLGGVTTCASRPARPAGIGFACCTTPYHPGALPAPGNAPPHVDLDLELAFVGPLLVNDASKRKRDGSDDARTNLTALRRADGRVWLPASSLRGALRQRAEFLLRSLDPNAPPGAGPIERLFGTTSRASRLRIAEPNEVGACEFLHQDFVAIDRFTGGAAEGLKFDATHADRPRCKTRLVLEIEGLVPEDLALFATALADLCRGEVPLGFGGSKGHGAAVGSLDDAGRKLLESLDYSCLSDLAAQAGPAAPPAVSAPSAAVPKTNVTQVEQGVLIWLGKDKKRRRALESPRNKLPYQLAEKDLRDDLRKREEDRIDVDFELEGGQPRRVRPRGEPWDRAQPQGGNAGGPVVPAGRFANPYYFLPAKDRAGFPGELADGPPKGHERYLPGHYSGLLRVRLTTETPLLICDRGDEPDANGHRRYGVLLQDGKPLLASSSVRGMLRAAYEAITNSRFGVFPAKPDEPSLVNRGNARRHGYRMTATEGLSLVPVRIEGGQARLMLGTNPGLPFFDKRDERWVVPGGLLHAAWAPRYRAGAITLSGNPPQHRQEAWCWLELIQHKKRPFKFWLIRHAAGDRANLPAAPPCITPSDRYKSLEETRIEGGYFHVSNRNNDKKHDERFFFGPDPNLLPIPEPVLRDYRDLVADYQAIHEREIARRRERGNAPTDYLGREPGKTAFSRHAYEPDALEVDDGTLCYARVDSNHAGRQIVALYPVIISRRIYPRTPWDLLPERLRPASRIESLSPADRVFGWVSQDERTVDAGEPAYRSHVRIGPVECVSEGAIDCFDSPRPLAILAQPKPQQGRFYLGGRNGGAHTAGQSKEEVGYRDDNRIRGPKVYPHHREGVKDEDAFTTETSDQNRSIRGWVRPKVAFEFDLRFVNLSRFELGALLWLLGLEDGHFLRLGLGKPLGFGSVRATIDEGQSRIAPGERWSEKIGTTASPASIEDAERMGLVDEFKAAIGAANPQLLPAFLRAASGFHGIPIHNPRLARQAPNAPEHFEWFVANEREKRLPLPNLWAADPSLPSNPQ